jgi:hypothetical protein
MTWFEDGLNAARRAQEEKRRMTDYPRFLTDADRDIMSDREANGTTTGAL